MRKGVLVVVLLAVLGLLAYAGYHSDDKQRAGGSGKVFSRDSGSRLKSEAKPTSSSSADSTSSTDTQSDQTAKQPDAETVVYPAAVQPQAPATAQSQAPGAAGGVPMGTPSQQAAPATAPPGDTISPNPPNGMAFAGSGRYQLYRQGNLTWRLDTETGRSCVVFATDEEWKKPRVYKAGCGRS